MGAEEFDARIAEEAGISAKTVQNLRSELGAKGRGWLKAIPVKDEYGEVLRWDVGLTAGAPEPDPGRPDPDPIHAGAGSGVLKPKTGGFGYRDPDIPGYGVESGSGSGSGAPESVPTGCPIHPDAGLWRACDGRWRCRDCEPPVFAGEIVAERQ
jgi:hypothetical protein